MHSIVCQYLTFQVFVPMHINGNHWGLLVLNFIKKEVQILESLGTRDEDLEKALVSTDPLRIMYQLLCVHL